MSDILCVYKDGSPVEIGDLLWFREENGASLRYIVTGPHQDSDLFTKALKFGASGNCMGEVAICPLEWGAAPHREDRLGDEWSKRPWVAKAVGIGGDTSILGVHWETGMREGVSESEHSVARDYTEGGNILVGDWVQLRDPVSEEDSAIGQLEPIHAMVESVDSEQPSPGCPFVVTNVAVRKCSFRFHGVTRQSMSANEFRIRSTLIERWGTLSLTDARRRAECEAYRERRWSTMLQAVFDARVVDGRETPKANKGEEARIGNWQNAQCRDQEQEGAKPLRYHDGAYVRIGDRLIRMDERSGHQWEHVVTALSSSVPEEAQGRVETVMRGLGNVHPGLQSSVNPLEFCAPSLQHRWGDDWKTHWNAKELAVEENKKTSPSRYKNGQVARVGDWLKDQDTIHGMVICVDSDISEMPNAVKVLRHDPRTDTEVEEIWTASAFDKSKRSFGAKWPGRWKKCKQRSRSRWKREQTSLRKQDAAISVVLAILRSFDRYAYINLFPHSLPGFDEGELHGAEHVLPGNPHPAWIVRSTTNPGQVLCVEELSVASNGDVLRFSIPGVAHSSVPVALDEQTINDMEFDWHEVGLYVDNGEVERVMEGRPEVPAMLNTRLFADKVPDTNPIFCLDVSGYDKNGDVSEKWWRVYSGPFLSWFKAHLLPGPNPMRDMPRPELMTRLEAAEAGQVRPGETIDDLNGRINQLMTAIPTPHDIRSLNELMAKRDTLITKAAARRGAALAAVGTTTIAEGDTAQLRGALRFLAQEHGAKWDGLDDSTLCDVVRSAVDRKEGTVREYLKQAARALVIAEEDYAEASLRDLAHIVNTGICNEMGRPDCVNPSGHIQLREAVFSCLRVAREVGVEVSGAGGIPDKDLSILMREVMRKVKLQQDGMATAIDQLKVKAGEAHDERISLGINESSYRASLIHTGVQIGLSLCELQDADVPTLGEMVRQEALVKMRRLFELQKLEARATALLEELGGDDGTD